MAKFLFFPYSNQLGTTIPSITVANMLRENGHEVIYASNGNYTNVLVEKGFEVMPINEISYHQYRKHVDENNVDFYQEALIHHLVDKDLEVINKVNPDVIVSNNRPSVKISAQLAKKKLVTIVIPTLTRFYNHQYFIPENHFLNTAYPFGDVNGVTPAGFRRFAFLMTMKQWGKNFNKVLKSYQLPLMQDFLGVYEGDVTLINQTKGLSPFMPLPSNYFFLDQHLGSTFGASHSWAGELDEHKRQGRKIIFVSMGSSSLKSYPLVMETIKDMVLADDRFVLISNHVGLKVSAGNNQRIYLEKFIHSKQILPLADLVVTHGGVNTLSECILNKKPVIGVPEQGEQLWNLKYAEHLGIGKMVSKFKLEKNPSLLKDAILSVIDDEVYQKNIIRFVDDLMDKKDNHEQTNLFKAILNLV